MRMHCKIVPGDLVANQQRALCKTNDSHYEYLERNTVCIVLGVAPSDDLQVTYLTLLTDNRVTVGSTVSMMNTQIGMWFLLSR